MCSLFVVKLSIQIGPSFSGEVKHLPPGPFSDEQALGCRSPVDLVLEKDGVG